MSDLRINNITDRTGNAGPIIAGVSTVSSTGVFTVPVGPTEYRGGRGRGVFAGGYNPGGNNTMEYIEIATTGNATDFGDLNKNSANAAAFGSSTKGIFCGGYYAPAANTDKIQYVIFSSRGGASFFGDLITPAINNIGFSNNVRGFSAGSYNNAPQRNAIEMITISTHGHASDFGDMTQGVGNAAACASPTRGVIAGGETSPNTYTRNIEYITMATKGDTKEFGELTTTVGRDPGGMSNSTRGLFGGGRTSPASARSDVIDYITIATTGNATDFGNLLAATSFIRGCASQTRAVWGGGQAPGAQNVMQYVTISTTGNAVDFGDLDDGTPFSISVCSDVHGGLG